MRTYRLHWQLHPEKDDNWYEEQKARMTADEVARELDISYEYSVRGIVFPEFTQTHVLGKFTPNPMLPVIRYVDYGRVNACLFSQKDPMGRLTFFQEIVLEDSDTPDQAKAIQAYSASLSCSGFRDYDDPAGSYKDHRSNTTDVQIMERHGIRPTHVASVRSGPNRRNDRVQLTKLKLSERVQGHEIIQVTENCQITLDAFRFGYRYKQDAQGKPLDAIAEEHPYEDVMDCLCGTILEEFTVREIKIPPVRRIFRDKYTGY